MNFRKLLYKIYFFSLATYTIFLLGLNIASFFNSFVLEFLLSDEFYFMCLVSFGFVVVFPFWYRYHNTKSLEKVEKIEG